MRLYQLANDEEEYGAQAGYWLVVNDTDEEELAGPFATEAEAYARMKEIAALDALTGEA